MVKKHLLLLIFIAACSWKSFAQDILTGIWEGKFLGPSALDLGQPKLVVEIYNVKDTVFSGITHLYYEGNLYEHYKIIGWYDKKNALLVFREVSTIAVDLGKYGNCLGTYMTSLKKETDGLFQFGYWRSHIKSCSPNTDMWLQKKEPEIKKENPPVISLPVIKKPVVKKPPVKEKQLPQNPNPPVVQIAPVIRSTPTVIPPKVSQRETDLQSLIEIAAADKDSIRIDVYDNGEIDGDSVSVFVEHDQPINKRMITAKPITFYISLDKKTNPISHIRLVAESLGAIPPCTALMIVTTNSRRYEVRLSSNFSKNATVELFLKE